jgi:hypothetical protein
MSKPHSAHLLGEFSFALAFVLTYLVSRFLREFLSRRLSVSLQILQIAPLLFDTIVTALTVWKAFTIRRRNGGPSSKLIQTFLREGVSCL